MTQPNAEPARRRTGLGILALAAVAVLTYLAYQERLAQPPHPQSAIPAPGAAGIALAASALAGVGIAAALGVDVRVALFLGSIPLFLAQGDLAAMFKRMVAEMANAGTVAPICSAMAFAHVLKLTGCDQELVRLLLHPLRGMRALLVPGGILAGYLINTTIVSQAATAAVLGPILVPLLRAGGLSAVSAGAVLLLGASMGGELYNPGAVEIRKLAELLERQGAEVVARLTPLNLVACATALGVFCLLESRRTRSHAPEPETQDPPHDEPPIRILKALTPLVPIALLLVDGVIGPNAVTRPFEGPPKILAAILIGVAAAAWSDPRSIRGLAEAFWAGAGQGYYHVISLIVAASTFAQGVQSTGVIGLVATSLAGARFGALVVAALMPWTLATIVGTGIAPAIAVMEFFVPSARDLGLNPFTLGAVASLRAHFGRPMSPAAAVVATAARISGTQVRELVTRVAPPLLAAGLVMLAYATLVGAREISR